MNIKKLMRLIGSAIIINTMISLTIHPLSAASKPSVVAEAAIVMDGNSGQILYQKNIDASLAPASITKLLTALLVLENLEPEDTITFSRTAVLSIETGSSHIGLRENEQISMEAAMHALLLMSANEVANGLAEAVSGSIEAFCLDMNERAKALGCTNTNFLNPNGLYLEDHTTSAYDMALITKELLKYPFFLEVMSHNTYQIPPTNIVNETRYLTQGHKMMNEAKNSQYYREDVIAGKTGYTVKAGHTLVTVSRIEDRTMIVVVLNTDANNLYLDTDKLLDYGYEGWHTVTYPMSSYQDALPISDAPSGSLAYISLDQDASLLLPEGKTLFDLEEIIEVDKTVSSDQALGSQVGQISLSLEGRTIISLPIKITDLKLVGQDEGSEGGQDDAQEASDDKKGGAFLIFFSVILIFVSIFVGGLYYYHKRTRMSYMAYKRMRDAQRESRHLP